MKAYKAEANKIVIGIVIGIVVASFVVGSVPALRWPLFRILWDYAIYRAQQRRVLLLCKTDHQALLDAGREILSQVPKDRLNPQPDGKTYLGSFPVPKGIRIPQAIRNLKPHVVVVDYYGYLTLEMHGGMDHFGIRVYPEDFNAPYSYFKYGGRKLTDGLWYYDDGYLHNPEYDKIVDEIIQKGKK